VLSSAEAPAGFHARHSARSRSYRYRLFTRSTSSPFELRRSWWVPRPVDEDALRAAAAALTGQNDFRAFTPAQTRHEVFVRVVERAELIRRGDHLDFEITANSYLRHMVRSLVGTMVEAPAAIPALLDGRARSEAGVTAPPWGLYLVAVSY
jgi:tRNA pseudouridine38-40 synthase